MKSDITPSGLLFILFHIKLLYLTCVLLYKSFRSAAASCASCYVMYCSDEIMEIAEPTAVVLLLSLLYNATTDSVLLHMLIQLLLKVQHLFYHFVLPEITKINVK